LKSGFAICPPTNIPPSLAAPWALPAAKAACKEPNKLINAAYLSVNSIVIRKPPPERGPLTS
jgi:hypothetical protein